MAFNMYNKRGYFYDVRNLPYSYYHGHPIEVMEYQRGRPTKLPIRQLNRQYKRTVVYLGNENHLEEKSALVISVQQQPTAKGKLMCLIFADVSCEVAETDEAPSGVGVSVPEGLAPQFIQQLRKIAKWKGSDKPPSGGQGLAFEDQVFKAHITQLPTGKFAIKILCETRARDPQERRELSSVLVPMEPGVMAKLKAALTDLLVSESPLYHTESLQVSDGSKLYLDLINEEAAHYLKVSHVTRDFRSIVIVPSGDVEAFRDLLNTSLKVMKSQQLLQPPEEAALLAGKAAGGKRKRGRNNPRRRPAAAGQKRRGGASGSDRSGSEGKENGANGESAAASPPDAEEDAANVKGDEEPRRSAAPPTAAAAAATALELCGNCEDNSTLESRPVENGDGPAGEKLLASE